MKWRHRIAQGFSPGSGPNEIALISGRPMRIARQSSLRPAFIACGWSWDPFEPSAPKRHGGDAHSAALSGRVYGLPNPGLKPWAILFRHFMARSGRSCRRNPSEDCWSSQARHSSITPSRLCLGGEFNQTLGELATYLRCVSARAILGSVAPLPNKSQYSAREIEDTDRSTSSMPTSPILRPD